MSTRRRVACGSVPGRVGRRGERRREHRLARNFRADIAAHASGGVYLNFIGNEGQERIRAAYGDTKYARLAAIKAEYDPHNVLRGNQNIVPAPRSVPSARQPASSEGTSEQASTRES